MVGTDAAFAIQFKEAQPVTVQPRRTATADFTGDGAPDLVGVRGDRLAVVVNDGVGGLSEKASRVLAGTSLLGIAAGDVTGDKQPEVVTIEDGQNSILIYDVTKEGTITGGPTAIPFAEVPTAVQLGDFDGDKDLDIVAAKRATREVVVYVNDGRGSFTAKPAVAVGVASVYSLGVSDMNGDGRADLAVAGTEITGNGILSVLFSNQRADLAAGLTGRDVLLPGTVGSVVTADFTGDGVADIVTANGSGGYSLSIIRFVNSQLRSINEIPCPGGLGGPLGLTVGELTNDEIQDVVVYGCEKAVNSAMLLTGGGTVVQPLFLPVRLFTLENPYIGGVIADFNRDGRGDLVTDGKLFLQQSATVVRAEEVLTTTTTVTPPPPPPPPPPASLMLKLLPFPGKRFAFTIGPKKTFAVRYNVSLKSDLTAKLSLLDAKKKPVKAVATIRRQGASGDGSFTFSLAKLKAGAYRVELTAVSSDGQRQTAFTDIRVSKPAPKKKR